MSKKRKSFRDPNPFIFALARGISKLLCRFFYNVKILRNDLEGKTGRYVIIANHESIIDVLPAYTVVPAKTHFVVSKAMMDSMPIAPLMEMCGAKLRLVVACRCLCEENKNKWVSCSASVPCRKKTISSRKLLN